MSAPIPFIVQSRPDTGLTNGKLGMWLFLASEVMLFGGLFSAYVLLRISAPQGSWPSGSDVLSVPIGTVNTLILITSSITMVMAWVALKMQNLARCRLFLTVTLLLALAFLVIKVGWEYRPKLHHYTVVLVNGEALTGHIEELVLAEDQSIDHVVFVPDAQGHEHPDARRIAGDQIQRLANFGPAQNVYFGIYWTLTSLHGLHVIGGVVALGWFIATGTSWWRHRREHYTHRIEYMGLYWHFVDLVWIFLFPVLYLL